MSKAQCPLGEDCDLTLAWMMGAERAKDTIKAQAAEIERLRAALRSLVSYTQCHYVDGYCVQHSSPDPCEMAEARAALEGK